MVTKKELRPEGTDARGVKIEIGATCIYGAPVGRSIALVEAVVDGFTDSGRVWLKVVRRAYGGGWSGSKERVHVGADRLCIVATLPDSPMPTEVELVAQNARERIERDRIYATHEIPPREPHRYEPPKCTRCGLDGYAHLGSQECAG